MTRNIFYEKMINWGIEYKLIINRLKYYTGVTNVRSVIYSSYTEF